VDDRSAFVPAGEIRHPAVFVRLQRKRPIAVHELDFLCTLTAKPIKVALPGPYLLTRTMWMECISGQAYMKDISADIVRVLREELAELKVL
jgi:5-methyltetrahydropteroyltriglutamate--homocysteine methyltransferase